VLADRYGLYAYLWHHALARPFAGLRAEGADDTRLPPSGEGRLRAPPELDDGIYRLEVWNTFDGTIVERREVTLDASHRWIPIPSHRADVAIRLLPVAGSRPPTSREPGPR
ncbi:MAG: hypothetical protein MI919_28570, partial [Holophagales bacterium]|nr:hypothetical protein [Holophagales bacterium]